MSLELCSMSARELADIEGLLDDITELEHERENQYHAGFADGYEAGWEARRREEREHRLALRVVE